MQALYRITVLFPERAEKLINSEGTPDNPESVIQWIVIKTIQLEIKPQLVRLTIRQVVEQQVVSTAT